MMGATSDPSRILTKLPHSAFPTILLKKPAPFPVEVAQMHTFPDFAAYWRA